MKKLNCLSLILMILSSNVFAEETDLDELVRNNTGKIEELEQRTNRIEKACKVADSSEVKESQPIPSNFDEADLIQEQTKKIETLTKRIEQLEKTCNIINTQEDQITETIKLTSIEEIKNLSGDKVIFNAKRYIELDKTQEARNILNAFIEQHPNDIYNGMMYFYIGNSYINEQKYSNAALAYMKGFQINPTGSKAPDTLYNLSVCFMHLGQPDKRKTTLEKLKNSFPNFHDINDVKLILESL